MKRAYSSDKRLITRIYMEHKKETPKESTIQLINGQII
jgi:hypothetical protein